VAKPLRRVKGKTEGEGWGGKQGNEINTLRKNKRKENVESNVQSTYSTKRALGGLGGIGGERGTETLTPGGVNVGPPAGAKGEKNNTKTQI